VPSGKDEHEEAPAPALDSGGFLEDTGEICQKCSAPAVADEDFCAKCRKTSRKTGRKRKQRKNVVAAPDVVGEREPVEQPVEQPIEQAFERDGAQANEDEKVEEDETDGEDDEYFTKAAFFHHNFEQGEKEEKVRKEMLGVGPVNWRALHTAVKEEGGSVASWKHVYARYCALLNRSPIGGVKLPRRMAFLYDKYVKEYAESVVEALIDNERELDEGGDDRGGAMDDTESNVDILDTGDFNQVRACQTQTH
jgi:hypothetical protein